MSHNAWANSVPLVFTGAIEVVDEETVTIDTKQTRVWDKYLVYLVQWAVDHAHHFYIGMSPAGFDEWCDNEDSE